MAVCKFVSCNEMPIKSSERTACLIANDHKLRLSFHHNTEIKEIRWKKVCFGKIQIPDQMYLISYSLILCLCTTTGGEHNRYLRAYSTVHLCCRFFPLQHKLRD